MAAKAPYKLFQGTQSMHHHHGTPVGGVNRVDLSSCVCPSFAVFLGGSQDTQNARKNCTESDIVTPLLCAPSASENSDLKAMSPYASRQSTGKMTNRPHVAHIHGTPPLSVCRLTPRSQSKQRYGVFPFPRENMGGGYRSGKKGIHHRGLRPRKRKMEGFHGGGYSANRGLPLPLGNGVCETKSQKVAPDTENPSYIGFTVLGGGLRLDHGLGMGPTMG